MKDADIIENTPPAFRSKILRLVSTFLIWQPASSRGTAFLIWQVAGKVTLAARVDAYQDHGGGAVGQRFRDEIEARSRRDRGEIGARSRRPSRFHVSAPAV